MPPTLRQLENCCEQQLLSSHPNVSEESRSPSSTGQLAPSQTLISPNSSLVSCQRQHNTQNRHSRAFAARAASMIEFNGTMSSLTPNTSYLPPNNNQSNLNVQDERIPPRMQLLDVPMFEDEQHQSMTMCTNDSAPILTVLTPPPSILPAPLPQMSQDHLDKVVAPANNAFTVYCVGGLTAAHADGARYLGDGKDNAKVVGIDEQASNTHSNREFTPMAQLIQEYSSVMIESHLGSTEMNITSVLSLEELTLDLIVDRGENRKNRLARYYLGEATMSNVCAVVSAQQIFLQRAAALILGRKSYFKVDPGGTLIPILQGTSSLPQLYTVWRALTTRIKLGVKAWEKYIAEYQLQVGADALSSLSTLHC